MAAPDFSPFTSLLQDTLTRKDKSYGYNGLTQESILKRLGEKMGRIERGAQDERLDTWLDIAGYAAIGWLIEKGQYYPGGDKPRVYVACPIDAANTSGYDSEVLNLVTDLHGLGIEHYVPVHAWKNAKGSDVAKQVNELALRHSTLLIAVWNSATTPSVGVPFEMAMAKELGIPVWMTPVPSSAYLRPLVAKAFNGTEEVLNELRAQYSI